LVVILVNDSSGNTPVLCADPVKKYAHADQHDAFNESFHKPLV
jgi:hypothetical protein